MASAKDDMMRNLDDHAENDAEAVDAERTGRTNAARAAADGQNQAPGRWDAIGEGGEGLDELQGLYAADATPPVDLAERGAVSSASTIGSPRQTSTAITPEHWDKLEALEGETIETPKGEPFRVIVVARGERVTVSPLDGGQEWDVSVRELAEASRAVSDGAQLDGLASIRLQEAGLGLAHPEYVAGLLHALSGSDRK